MSLSLRVAIALVAYAVPASAQAAWHQASSKHFIIYADQSPNQIREYAARLEQFDAAVRALRKIEDPPVAPSARLTIFVVKDVNAVRRLADARDSWLAGFYIARSSGSIAVVPQRTSADMGTFDEDVVFFHEYAHHLMFEQLTQSVPSWFSEGFAEFFSTAKFERDGAIMIGIAPGHRSFGVFTRDGISYASLLSGNYSQEMNAEQSESLYGRGWLLAHYLTFAPSRSGQLGDYLTRLAKGEKSAAAATRAFGDLKQLEREIGRYIVQRRLSSVRVKSDAAAIGTIEVRQLTSGEAAILPIRTRSKVGVSDKTAPDVLARAHQVAQSYTKDLLVAVSLAEAALDTRDYDRAISAATLALELDQKSVEARLMRGRALLGRSLKQASKSDVKAAREDFLAANKLEPEHPEPLRAFYESYMVAGEPPSGNAVSALHYSAALAPADRGLRWMSAQQYLIDGKTAEARVALGPLAFDPHGGAMAADASEVVALIDAGKGSEALDRLQREPAKQKEAD